MISTHATHKGGDSAISFLMSLYETFQLTPPIRAATGNGRKPKSEIVISTHATHKGGDASYGIKCDIPEDISTHATHKGGDQSGKSQQQYIIISTHATHKGGDASGSSWKHSKKHFNSRHP